MDIDRLYGGREDKHTGESGSNGCSLAPPESTSHGEVARRKLRIRFTSNRNQVSGSRKASHKPGRVGERRVYPDSNLSMKLPKKVLVKPQVIFEL